MKKLLKPKIKKRRLWVLLGLLLLIALFGGVYYKKNLSENKVATGGEILEDTQIDKLVEAEEDNSNEEAPVVPDDVNPDSIKQYELITENELYKIRKLDDTYTITLYAIINRPDQAQTYRDQLKEYKGYALKYLEDQGVKTSKAKIIYEPEEATNL